MNDWVFATAWESIAAVQPDALALAHGDHEITWSQFDQRANGLAQFFLNSGCKGGASVAFYLHNGPEYLETFFACSKASLVHVNTNYRYGTEELSYLWDNGEARAVVFHGTFTTTVAELRDQLPGISTYVWVDDGSGSCPEWAVDYADAIATPTDGPIGLHTRSGDDLLLLYTGGTTGMPKGVMWRQDDLLMATDATNRVRLPAEPDLDSNGRIGSVAQRVLERPGPSSIPACPLMHGTGLFNAMATLMLGGSITTLTSRRLDIEELFDTIQARRIKSVFIVGDAFARPMLDALEAEPDRWDVSSLRVIISSGVMWSADTKAGLMRHNEGLLCVDTYGSSEAIGIGSSVSSNDGATKTASFSLSDRSAVITEDGRFVEPGSGETGRVGVAGRVPLGYFKDPERTAQTFPTVNGVRYSVPGDFATVEADGTIVLLGRGSVCINTGGEKVFPEEVEEVLKEHPDVADAIVVGVPHERFGQTVAAVVATDSSPEAEDLIAHVKDRLAAYKAPRQIAVVPSLERAANGKVDYKRWTEFMKGSDPFGR